MVWTISDTTGVSHGAIQLEYTDGSKFKVNGQRVKHYLGEMKDARLVEIMYLDKL